MTYKIIKRLCPGNLLDKHLSISCFSSNNMINSQDLQIPRCRTECFKKSFQDASLKAWNDIIIYKSFWRFVPSIMNKVKFLIFNFKK